MARTGRPCCTASSSSARNSGQSTRASGCSCSSRAQKRGASSCPRPRIDQRLIPALQALQGQDSRRPSRARQLDQLRRRGAGHGAACGSRRRGGCPRRGRARATPVAPGRAPHGGSAAGSGPRSDGRPRSSPRSPWRSGTSGAGRGPAGRRGRRASGKAANLTRAALRIKKRAGHAWPLPRRAAGRRLDSRIAAADPRGKVPSLRPLTTPFHPSQRGIADGGVVDPCVAEFNYLEGGSCPYDPLSPGPGGERDTETARSGLGSGDGIDLSAARVTERIGYKGPIGLVTERSQGCQIGMADCPGIERRTQKWEVAFHDPDGWRTTAIHDERGFWSEMDYVLLDGGVGDPLPPNFLAQTRAGLLARTALACPDGGVIVDGGQVGDCDCESAQEVTVAPAREWYDWAYVGGEDAAAARAFDYQPYAQRRRRASVVVVPAAEADVSLIPDAKQSITHVRLRPGTNLREAVIQEGYAYGFNPVDGKWSGQPVRRYLARFFLPEYRATTPGGGEDPYGRTLEEHGPCWVSSLEAQGCDVPTDGLDREAKVPVTRYEYRSDQYLAARAVYADCVTTGGGAVSCAESSALRTTFDAYDARGNLLESTDPNGLKTRMEYLSGQLTAFAVGGRSTTYAYDSEGRVSLQRLPTGVEEHFCYQIGADAECGGGVGSDLLQWKSRVDEKTGTVMERVAYRYAARTSRMVEERIYVLVDGVEELRRINHLAQDPFGRTTAMWAGDGPSRSRTFAASGYDSADNLTRSGGAYHAPPPFCLAMAANGAEPSAACRLFQYDSLDRLIVASSPVSPSQAGQRIDACMAYDSNGHVRKVIQGCLEGCEACLGYDREAAAKAQSVDWRVYVHDDFGRLAWTEGLEMERPARFQYDAQGNVLLRNTATMEDGKHLETQYDSSAPAPRGPRTAKSSTNSSTIGRRTSTPTLAVPRLRTTPARLGAWCDARTPWAPTGTCTIASAMSRRSIASVREETASRTHQTPTWRLPRVTSTTSVAAWRGRYTLMACT